MTPSYFKASFKPFMIFLRGSNDNAALYWTMRMLEGGEDPLFIARYVTANF
jgi:replication-associated recombination protein RarA